MKETAGYAPTKDCQVKLHGMTKVTLQSIAYAAVHVSFISCSTIVQLIYSLKGPLVSEQLPSMMVSSYCWISSG